MNNQNYGEKNIEEIPIELGNYENKNTIQKALRTKLELTKKEIQSETKLKHSTRQPKKDKDFFLFISQKYPRNDCAISNQQLQKN